MEDQSHKVEAYSIYTDVHTPQTVKAEVNVQAVQIYINTQAQC